MFMNCYDIKAVLNARHECPNVRKGIRLLYKLMEATDAQSDGWAYWDAPCRSSRMLQDLLATAGNLFSGTHGTISEADLKKAITPIRRMVTVQREKQKNYGNTFEFNVDAALKD